MYTEKPSARAAFVCTAAHYGRVQHPDTKGQGRGPGVKFFDNGRKSLPNVEEK